MFPPPSPHVRSPSAARNEWVELAVSFGLAGLAFAFSMYSFLRYRREAAEAEAALGAARV